LCIHKEDELKHLIFLAAVAACSSRLGADTIIVTPGSYSVGMTYTGGATPVALNSIDAGSYTFFGMTASVSPYPNELASATSGDYGSVGAYVNYYITVLGTDGIVPLLFHYNMTATGSTTGSSTAELAVSTNIDSESVAVQGNSVVGNSILAGILHVNYLINGSNAMGGIQLQVSASGPSTAFVDPYIEVDPTFANASSYTILLSPGFANTPLATATPEPSSIFLVGIGLGGAMLVRRRFVLG
jgi:PEP-CTERM motif